MSRDPQYIEQFNMDAPITRSDAIMRSLDEELAVCSWLKAKKLNVRKLPYRSKWDIAVNGHRVEIKSAWPTKETNGYAHLCWQFNIHRHNVLLEHDVDVYIFRLNGVPSFKAAVHLVIPAPVNRKVIRITLRSLIFKWGRYAHPNRLKIFNEVKVPEEGPLLP